MAATEQDLKDGQAANTQALATLKGNLETLTGLVDQLIAKVGNGTPLDFTPEVQAEAALGTDMSTTNDEVSAAITKAKAALGQS